MLLILVDQGQPKEVEEEDKQEELEDERGHLSSDHFPCTPLQICQIIFQAAPLQICLAIFHANTLKVTGWVVN